MNQSFEEYGHSVLQKLIIVFLGLLMTAVLFQSCASHENCAAYSKIEVENPE